MIETINSSEKCLLRSQKEGCTTNKVQQSRLSFCLLWLTKPKTQVTSFMLVVIDFVFEPRLSTSGCVHVHIKRGVCEFCLLWSVTLSAIMMKYMKTTANVTIKCNTVANMRRDQRSRILLIWCFSAQNGKKPPKHFNCS